MSLLTRRSFVLGSGAGLLGTAAWAKSSAVFESIPQAPPQVGGPSGAKEKLPTLDAPTEQQFEKAPGLPPEERVGFAIVGLGHLALEEILPAFARTRFCKCVALVNGDPAKAERIAKQYGLSPHSIYSYKDFDRIESNKDIKVVYIVLPNSMHKEFVERSVKAGKDVLCEKPMATNAPEAQAMVEAAKKAKRKLMIAYRQQYEPYNRMIRELIRQKTYGAPKIMDAVNTQNQNATAAGVHQWRHVLKLAGGGALPDIGLYCLNGVRFLTGEEPTEVFASTYATPGDPRFREVEESVVWQMRFPSGLLANCATSYGAHVDRRYRVTAERGWFGMDPAFAYQGLKAETSHAQGDLELYTRPTIPESNQFANEMDHMADCVLHDKPPLTPGEEGVQDHLIMDAIYQSARERKPVSLKHYSGLDVFRNVASLR